MPFNGERLKLRRKQKGFTQDELAKALHTTQQTVTRWETGTQLPSTDPLLQMATLLGCTTDWLLGLVEEPTNRLQESELSVDERRLIDLYRRGDLPDQVRRLLAEAARPQAQINLVVDRRDEPEVPTDDVTLDG